MKSPHFISVLFYAAVKQKKQAKMDDYKKKKKREKRNKAFKDLFNRFYKYNITQTSSKST